MKLTILQKYHLHHRAEFFVHHTAIDANSDLDTEVDQLISKQKFLRLSLDMPEFDQAKIDKLSNKKKREKFKTFRQQSREFNALWVRYMIQTESALLEKMALFWHGHFACKTDQNPYLCIEMSNIVREHALGNFKTLLYAISKSASMIGYLHLRQNKKMQPNEDFARELCELFTLGRDIDYTENDVKEIARAFTGWTTDLKGNFVFNERQHDFEDKTIFGKTGYFNGEEVLDMLLENKNTARHICRKLYRYFVSTEVNESHVDELAKVFYESDYEISVLLKHLFKADWFYATSGKMIKAPIEFIVGLGRMFDLRFEHEKTLYGLEQYFGQVLFSPPNVAGWPGGRQWIDSSRLALRLRLGSLILNRGFVEDELSPDLDEMLREKQKKEKLIFYEEVDWDKFWKNNEGADLFDLMIRCDNLVLKSRNNTNEKKSVLHLLSTPDFQLI